jgi:hypothetical protein
LKLTNHWAIPPTLRLALEQTFHTTTELFGSPLNCPMKEGMTYRSAFPEDTNVGAIINSFQYRWTASCIANPEYKPEDMLQAVLHVLASSEHTDDPFLAVMVLPVWDDSPWTFAVIRGHTNMSTLIHIPTGHMRFVPAEKQTDEPSLELKPAKWPVELVLIANDMGREIYLDNDRIYIILSPAIRDICRLTPEETTFFPHLSTRGVPQLSGHQSARPAPYLTPLR